MLRRSGYETRPQEPPVEGAWRLQRAIAALAILTYAYRWPAPVGAQRHTPQAVVANLIIR